MDFIVGKGSGAQRAIQACYDLSDAATWRREVDALVRCSSEMGLREATIVNWDRSDSVEVDGVRIHVRPAVDWLREEGKAER